MLSLLLSLVETCWNRNCNNVSVQISRQHALIACCLVLKTCTTIGLPTLSLQQSSLHLTRTHTQKQTQVVRRFWRCEPHTRTHLELFFSTAATRSLRLLSGTVLFHSKVRTLAKCERASRLRFITIDLIDENVKFVWLVFANLTEVFHYQRTERPIKDSRPTYLYLQTRSNVVEKCTNSYIGLADLRLSIRL